MELKIHDSFLYTLTFADDQVVIAAVYDDASTWPEIQDDDEYEQRAIEISLENTEYLVMGADGHGKRCN